MPLFVCDKCRAIENTACGFYWGAQSDRQWFADPSLKGLAFCSECCPTEFNDGSKTRLGQWHGRWPKKIATPETIEEYGKDSFKPTAALNAILEQGADLG